MIVPDLQSVPADPTEIIQLLDDHHVVLLADDDQVRARYCAQLRDQLEALPGSRVIRISTGTQSPIDGFTAAYADQYRGSALLDGTLPALASVLRDGVAESESLNACRHEYIVWCDADLALEADVAEFGRVVNTLLAAAAEHEYVDPDVLVLQRIVFAGSAKLGAYAEEAMGQFRSWLTDDEITGPSADVVRCMAQPPVISYRIDG